MQIEREIALFQFFTVRSKRAWYAELLRSKKGRTKVRHGLDHFGDLDLRCCTKLSANERTPYKLSVQLRNLGALSSCYILSSNEEVDGKELELEEALGCVVGRGCGTFVCCVPGKLAYFEGEKPDDRYLCKR